MATEATEEKKDAPEPEPGRVDKYFGMTENQTNWKREVLAGTTTFLAMAYILAVNPGILSFGLSAAGVDAPNPGAVFTATALASALGCLVMGLWARYPIATAPGMGLNAFFAFTVVLTLGIPWQTALTGTLVSGVLFFILAVTGARESIINAIPAQLKLAVGAGIGLFIAFIGLKGGGIVVGSEATLVTIGDFTSGTVLLTVFGLVATAVFMVLGWKGGVFYGMLATLVLGVLTGVIDFELAEGFTPNLDSFGAAFTGFEDAFTVHMIAVILTMLFVDFFDTAGTLFAVAGQAGLVKDGKLPRAGRALATDSIATSAGAVLGTSTTTAYIESTAGVSVGGRTGLTAVTTGFWFIVSLVAFPVFGLVANNPAVTAPALIVVGVLMAKALGEIEWAKLEYAIPAFLIVAAMPLTYSISNGIALGLVFFPIMMAAKGRWREVHPIAWVLMLASIGYFLFLTE
ncbi:NCS2 family permease [Glycomyces scopariae]|uniref:Putative MFS transporter, AGZA family, xanthine/uracil permease n=1 Tax=Glycomyces sambucus TaxID=380244 RepID=A0A1G9GXS1_9ACTN|nr:NCS2 family permease [Glycomyces sambucus]SDL05510.1 putative MFS transporter, AGZA family, xanthine/uracil permease [Glycomyces sambucus]